jgi:hypothetical protein
VFEVTALNLLSGVPHFPELRIDRSFIKTFTEKTDYKETKTAVLRDAVLQHCTPHKETLMNIMLSGSKHLMVELEIIILNNYFVFITFATRNRGQLEHRKKEKLTGNYTMKTIGSLHHKDYRSLHHKRRKRMKMKKRLLTISIKLIHTVCCDNNS